MYAICITGIIVLIAQPALSCMCMPAHPQTHYCKSDYVIIARILRKTPAGKPGHDAYKIDIKKTYKMSEKAKLYLKEGRILTPSSDAQCGILPKIGKIYVISGHGGPNVRICNFVKEYKTMSIVERRGIAGAYRKGCSCKVNPCFGSICDDECKWPVSSKCETEHSVCVPNSRTKHCSWRHTPSYKACLINE